MLIEKKVNSIFRNTFIIRLVWGCSPQTLANFCVQKFDKKLYFSQATRLYAVGELGAASTRRAQPEASDLRENETFKFAQNRQRELRAGSACRAQPEASDLRENGTSKFAQNRQRELCAASSCRAQPEASDLRENGTSKFAQNRQREL